MIQMFPYMIVLLYSIPRYQSIEIVFNETTSFDSFHKVNVFIVDRVFTNDNFHKREIQLTRPLIVYSYIESMEIYALEYIQSVNNKLFPISFRRFQREDHSERYSQQSSICGYNSFDIRTAKPVKGSTCRHCRNRTCEILTNCIQSDDLWYNVFDIDVHQLHFSLYLHIYELNDDYTWRSIFKTNITGFPFVSRTVDFVNIEFIKRNENSTSNNLINENKYLLVRQPMLTMKDKNQELHNEFMAVHKSELNFDENDICKKVSNGTDHLTCSIACSERQPFDLWLKDKSNLMNKNSSQYAFRPRLEFPIYEHNRKLKFLIPYEQHFRVNITLEQSNEPIGFKCLVSIAEISVESFTAFKFQITAIINNTGLSMCSIRVSFKQTHWKKTYFVKSSRLSYEYHIHPMYEQLVFFTISTKQNQRKAVMSSTVHMKAKVIDLFTNLTLAERKFLLKYAHHCVCISICHCQCFKNSLIPDVVAQLKCISMIDTDMNRAGFSSINDARLLKLLADQTNPLVEITNEQSRYVRKWFLFIAVFALGLNLLLIYAVR